MTAIVCCHRCGHSCAHNPPHPLVETPDGPACADRDFCDQLAAADAGEHVEPYGAELARLEQERDAARAQGYAEAVARLRDGERYRHWWSGDGSWQHPAHGRYWDATARGHLADYLETVGPDGPDVTAGRDAGRADVERMRRELAREEREALQTIAERDEAQDWADKLAAAVARMTGVQIGEHSSMNEPWANALAAYERACAALEKHRAAEADLRATVERVRALHTPRPFVPGSDMLVCTGCDIDGMEAEEPPWPCRTITALDTTTPPPGPEGEEARTLRADLADEADWIDERGGMISAAWVADAMRHLAQYGHRRPRAGESTHIHNESTHIHNAPAALDGGQTDG